MRVRSRMAFDGAAHGLFGRGQWPHHRFADADDAFDAGHDALHAIDHRDQARREFVDLVDRFVEPLQGGVEVFGRLFRSTSVSPSPSRMVSTCSTVTSALSAACASFLIRSGPVRTGLPPLSAMTVIMTTRLEPQERTGRLNLDVTECGGDTPSRQCRADPWRRARAIDPTTRTAQYAQGFRGW